MDSAFQTWNLVYYRHEMVYELTMHSKKLIIERKLCLKLIPHGSQENIYKFLLMSKPNWYTKMSLDMPKLQMSPTSTNDWENTWNRLQTTLPSLRESNPWDEDQFHLIPNKKLKTRKTQQLAFERKETDSFHLNW